MCSVRQSPSPSAANSRAIRASAGVSALARTPRSRAASAHSSSRENAPPSSGAIIAGAPAITSPRVPSSVTRAPSPNTRPSRLVSVRSTGSRRSSPAPTTQGSPMPRAITAAWLVMPPRMVRTPRAACMPRMSSGLVSSRTRIVASSLAAAAWASSAVKTIRPVAAPGLAARPVANTSRFAAGSICGCRCSISPRGSIAQQCLGPRDHPGVGEIDGNAHRSARRPAHRHRVEHGDTGPLNREIQQARIAQARGGLRRDGVDRLARRRIERVDPGGGFAGARAERPRKLRRAGAAGDELDMAARPRRHPLDDEAEARGLRRAARLPENAGRRRVPGAGEGAGRGGDLDPRILRPRLAGPGLEQRQHLGEPPAQARRVGLGSRQRLEVRRIETMNGVGEGRDRPHLPLQRLGRANLRRQRREAAVAGPDVEKRAGTAPAPVPGTAAHREQIARGQRQRQIGQIAARRKRRDAVERQRHPVRHRQPKRLQAREIGGAPAIPVGTDRVTGIERDDGVGRLAEVLPGFHCSAA